MLLLISLLSLSQSSFAINYFENGINYWSDDKEQKAKEEPIAKNQPIPKKDEKFSWNEYLNPNKDKFFDEGNYSPPKPYLELIRNPTDQNIKNWFKIVDTKNKMLTKLQERVQEYSLKNKQFINGAKNKIATLESLKSKPDIERFHFRLYIDSKCPHCQRMLNTMKSLQDDGYFVEVKQIDDDFKATQGIPLNITPANKADIHKKDIQSVPVLFVGDLNKKQVFRVQGYRDQNEIFQIIKTGPSYK